MVTRKSNSERSLNAWMEWDETTPESFHLLCLPAVSQLSYKREFKMCMLKNVQKFFDNIFFHVYNDASGWNLIKKQGQSSTSDRSVWRMCVCPASHRSTYIWKNNNYAIARILSEVVVDVVSIFASQINLQ